MQMVCLMMMHHLLIMLFFVFDSVMAWRLPFVGGDIKLGENIIRYAIKKVYV